MSRFLLVFIPVVLILAVLLFFSASFFNNHIVGSVSHGISGRILAVAGIFDRFKKDQEVSKLKDERDQLLSKLAELEQLKLDNAELRQILKLPPVVRRSILDAGIYSITQTPAGHVALINRGLRDGVSVDDVIISPTGILVGRIKSVFAGYSQVELVSDPLFKATARALSSGTAGIAVGLLGEGVHLDFVSQTDVINQGETVVTSGNDLYPAGLIIGAVKSIVLDPGGLFKYVKIEPAFRGVDLARVLINIQ